MWSLPDINALNSNAKKFASTIKRICNTGLTPEGEAVTCMWNANGNGCRGDVRVYPWYDIFSDDPKGYFGLCQAHDGYYGDPTEGYFTCQECGRIFTENYIWERYESPSGLCLNCYRKNYLADPKHWIDLTKRLPNLENDSSTVISGSRVRCNSASSLVRRAPHLLAVGQEVPADLVFMGNVEFDSLDGHCISGGGTAELRELLEQAKDRGYERAILILDAAYQFAESIGVYVEKLEVPTSMKGVN